MMMMMMKKKKKKNDCGRRSRWKQTRVMHLSRVGFDVQLSSSFTGFFVAFSR